MFLGTHTPRLDDKGRLILPAKYRDELAPGLVLTKGQERCLYVFPRAEFARIAEALRTAPVSAKAGDRGQHPSGDLGLRGLGCLSRSAGGRVLRGV